MLASQLNVPIISRIAASSTNLSFKRSGLDHEFKTGREGCSALPPLQPPILPAFSAPHPCGSVPSPQRPSLKDMRKGT